jgi:hypothetical protein
MNAAPLGHILIYSIGSLILYGLGSCLIALVFSSKKPDNLNPLVRLTYGMTSALILVSLLFWIFYTLLNHVIPAYWSTVILVLVATFICRAKLTKFLNELSRSCEPPLIRQILFDILIALCFAICYGLLEKYLPEYDGYAHERMSQILLQTDKVNIFSATYRPGFLYLFVAAKVIWPSAIIFFTKFFFPFFITFLTIQNFRLWIKPGTSLLFGWIIPLSAPLFVSQAIYFRAQSIVAVFLPLAAYTLFVRPERRFKYFIIGLAFAGLLFYHIFFSFVLLFALPFLITELRRTFSWNLREKILLAVIFVTAWLLLLPHVSGIISTLLIYVNFSHFSLSLTPLISADGNAFTNIFKLGEYYTHQILFTALVALSVLAITYKDLIKNEVLKKPLTLLAVAMAVLFVGAEILPRFGLQYDPQRIWIFINILVICTLLLICSELSQSKQRQLVGLLSISALISLCLVGYFVHFRAKTFTQDDRDAISFINSQSPEALIIGPGVKYPGIATFKENNGLLFYISFSHLIHYADPIALDTDIKWLSYITPEFRRTKVLNLQAAGNEIQAAVAVESPIPNSALTKYQSLITEHAKEPQTIYIYVCNNITYCDEPGYSYTTQNAQLEQYRYLEKVYSNSTVTVYKYLPTPGPATPPSNYVYMEKVLLGSVDLTEFGSR